MSDGEVDTARTVVRAYVPAYQRDEWDNHADDLDMSRSEFVKTMVQAGRRAFEGESPDHSSTERAGTDEPARDSETDVEPTGGGLPALEGRVIGALDEHDHLSWDELLEELTEDIEQRLETTLQRLQEGNRVRYSGRKGGYVLDE